MMNDRSKSSYFSGFRFKRFTVCQDRCPMKVGTDGVLLGAWTAIGAHVKQILDIGTGTGLIALMLAQRSSHARITGVDIHDVSQACENASASPWGDRVVFEQCPVQELTARQKFDLIVSNPPFFVDSLTCPDEGRTAARHAVHLSFEDLRDAVVRLLAPGGRFAAVLPTAESELFLSLCAGRLSLMRRTDVRATPRHPVKRVLLELSDGGDSVVNPEFSELVIGTGEPECYTPQYRALTRDFYLKF